MPTTLKLSEELLALARKYLQLGRDREALHVLRRLATFGELPAAVAEPVQAHLGELYHRRRKFSRARRHLGAALALQPNCARYHHLLATLHKEDDDGDLRRALHHYSRALDLAPDQSEYWCDYGLCLIATNETGAGLRKLAKAVEQAPDEVRFVQHLAMNQLAADQPKEARRTVQAALFRQPRETRLRRLWDELRFREAQGRQRRIGHDGAALSEREPILLPFVRPARNRPKKITAHPQCVLPLEPAATAFAKRATKRQQSR